MAEFLLKLRVGGRFGIQGYGLMVSLADGRHLESTGLTAIDMLRVLAALDLIPAELAEVRDERYGRCETCGEPCTWDSGHGTWEPRWLHLDPFRGQGHRAEITENNAPIENKEVGA